MLYQKEIPILDEYDIVVCGGGMSGFAAAYSAAREKEKVILIERNTSLGGVGTQGLVNHILGVRRYAADNVKTSVRGLFSKIENQLLETADAVDFRTVDPQLNPHGWLQALSTGLIFDCEKMKLLLEQMLTEVGVTILYYTDILDVVKQGNTITGVVIHNKSGLGIISGKYFIDATGDGDICHFAGCPSEIGDSENQTAAASLEMHVENVDTQALTQYMDESGDRRFRNIINNLKEQHLWPFPYDIFISVKLMKEDVYMINTIRQVGVNGLDAKSLTDAVISGRKENYCLLEIMRNYFPGFHNATIRQIAPVIGIRETRRIRSEYTLTVEDLINGTDFPDGIALSAYGWDLPHPKEPSFQPQAGVKRKSLDTQIPYRCLLPLGISNLIMAGRCIGAEREALGPVRVMGPCLAMGECAGIASSLALKEHIAFREVDIPLLQKTITSHSGLINRDQT